ncbi:MAG: preprotein translocase subunit SecA, partial [Gammaproteobacteria bacterium]
DIKLSEPVLQNQGLFVVLTERHDSRHIDRQLAGRCARQGDPGRYLQYLSLQDELVTRFGRPWMTALLAVLLKLPGQPGSIFGLCYLSFCQSRAERLNSRIRKQLLKSDRQVSNLLAWSGTAEK